MKTLLTFLAVTMLNGAFLYPLFFLGVGRKVSWVLVAGLLGGGIGCLYLLVKFRRRL